MIARWRTFGREGGRQTSHACGTIMIVRLLTSVISGRLTQRLVVSAYVRACGLIGCGGGALRPCSARRRR